MTTSSPTPKQLTSVHKTIPAATIRTVSAMILREMSTTYGRSPGGYAWALLEPILGIAFLTVVFALGFRSPPLGNNFPLFYATGLLPFAMFFDIANKVASSINYSKALLNYPRVTFVDAILARMILSTMTQTLVTYVLITGILLVWDTRTALQMDRVLLAMVMTVVCGAGFGVLNCFLFTMYPLWQQAWSILTRPLFLLSGVFILYETFPPVAQDYLWWNPLLHITGEMRAAFYLEYQPEYLNPMYVFGLSLVLLLTGLIFLRQYHRDMMEK